MTREDIKDKLLGLKLKKELAADKTRRASRLLFYIGSAYLVFGLLQADSFISTLFVTCVSLVMIMLGLLSRKNPLVPLIIAFVVLLSASLIDFLNFDKIGFIGIIIRVVLLGFLASGIYHLFAADRILSEYDQMEEQFQK